MAIRHFEIGEWPAGEEMPEEVGRGASYLPGLCATVGYYLRRQ
jgi:hypothetical protein